MELLDAANYTEKLLQREEDLVQLIKNYPNDAELGSVETIWISRKDENVK